LTVAVVAGSADAKTIAHTPTAALTKRRFISSSQDRSGTPMGAQGPDAITVDAAPSRVDLLGQ
jgi:hypothetical protein